MGKYNGILPLVISIVGHITVTPIILAITLINEIVRLVTAIFLQFKYNGEIKLVSDGADAIWETHLPGKSRNALGFNKLKGNKLDIEEVLKTYEKGLHDRDKGGNRINEKYEYILISKMGYACWKRDKKFKIRNHIRVVDNPEKVYNKADMKELVRELHKDMPDSKPQWEVVIVPRYKDEGKDHETMCTVSRFNHAYLDGLSMNMFVQSYLSTNFTYFLDPLNFFIPTWQIFFMYANAILFAPYVMFYLLRLPLQEHWAFTESLSTKKTIMERNSTWTSEISLDYIRTIRKATNGTTLSSTIQNAFISATKQVLPLGRIPKQWLVSELAAILPYPDQKPRNRFTGFPYSIDSSLEDFLRLKQSKESALESKLGPFIPLGLITLRAVGRMPTFTHSIVSAFLKCSILFSNLPTSRSKYKGLQGADVMQIICFPPQPFETGIIICNTSYANSTVVSVTADSDQIKREELEDIVGRIPRIIERWAKKAEKLIPLEKSQYEKLPYNVNPNNVNECEENGDIATLK